MEERYWTYVNVLLVLIVGSAIVTILLSLFTITGLINKMKITKKFATISLIIISLTMVLCIHSAVPYAKDYKYVSEGVYFEDDAVVFDFTEINQDLDGTGKTEYIGPKFYIESKNEYVVVYVRDVELGEKYRIRYLPNTGLGEVLYHIEE